MTSTFLSHLNFTNVTCQFCNILKPRSYRMLFLGAPSHFQFKNKKRRFAYKELIFLLAEKFCQVVFEAIPNSLNICSVLTVASIMLCSCCLVNPNVLSRTLVVRFGCSPVRRFVYTIYIGIGIYWIYWVYIPK